MPSNHGKRCSSSPLIKKLKSGDADFHLSGRQKLEQMIIPKAGKDGIQWTLLVNFLKTGMYWRQYHALLSIFWLCHMACRMLTRDQTCPLSWKHQVLTTGQPKEDATWIPSLERAIQWYVAYVASFKHAYHLVSQLYFLNFK